jgi:hypothetical protein
MACPTAAKIFGQTLTRARKATGYDTANDHGEIIEEIRP